MNLAEATWRKSSRSNMNGCVEVAFLGERVAIRDSKDRSASLLVFDLNEWEAFIGGVRNGEFDSE